MVVLMYVLNNVWWSKKTKQILPLWQKKIWVTEEVEETCVVAWIMIREREDISELECLVISGIIRLNDYGVLIGRGKSCGEGQVDWFYSIGRRGLRSL